MRFINEQHSTSSLLDELFAIGRKLGYFYQFPSSPETQPIIDDHVAFVNYGIPSADLIINFWNNPSWPYHHTVRDNRSYVSNSSLEISGKTVEQFIYINYFDDQYNTYQGNFPWNQDKNLLSLELLIVIIIIIAIAGISIIVLINRRKISENKGEMFEI